MEEWLSIVIRQLVLYSLPVLVSLTLVTLLEARFGKTEVPHPFYAICWRGTWVPLLAGLFFHRGVIVALPNYLQFGVKNAGIRFLTHLILFGAGLLLFSWSLSHMPPAGLPPLHHWWAKVLMYFNLCMIGLHLLPLPQLLVGELIAVYLNQRAPHSTLNLTFHWLKQSTYGPWVITFIAATSLLDRGLGQLVFPVYEKLATLAAQL